MASARMFAGTWLVGVITIPYMLQLFFLIQCGIAHFLCAMRVFQGRESSSSPRLPLWQIAFVLQPPLLS